MVSSKVLNGHLKTIRGIMLKSFAKVEERFDRMEGRMDGLENKVDSLENKVDSLSSNVALLSNDVEDLAGMTAREFKAVRSEIAAKTFKSNLRF